MFSHLKLILVLIVLFLAYNVVVVPVLGYYSQLRATFWWMYP